MGLFVTQQSVTDTAGQVCLILVFSFRKPFVPHMLSVFSSLAYIGHKHDSLLPICIFLFALFPTCLLIRNPAKGEVGYLLPATPSCKNLNMKALQRCHLPLRTAVGFAASEVGGGPALPETAYSQCYQ